jgi:hypothetical protein
MAFQSSPMFTTFGKTSIVYLTVAESEYIILALKSSTKSKYHSGVEYMYYGFDGD